MTTQCFLKFKSFNVEGLTSKLKDSEFCDSLKKIDFITLVETRFPVNKTINIEGYYCYNRSRPKAEKARWYSGGISVLVKKSLRKGVPFFFSKNNIMNLYGGNLVSSFFNLEEDIYVCSAYIPPANSRYYGKSEKDPNDELQTQLLSYSKLDKIILMWDFNARKGNLLDSSVDVQQ